MPYIEVLSSVDASNQARQALVATLTQAITTSFNVPPSAVTVFFQPVAPLHYGYRGELGYLDGPSRVFIKLHAYRRTMELRRAVAMSISVAAARCFGTTLSEVSIYFLEREFDEVTHDGVLVSDGPLPVL
jgi:phenylpyruvate tautomerase PptA (4-oxalocrotonate tautomerase family)